MQNIIYRAVGKRCAVILDSLKLPISNDRCLEILAEYGFKILEIDILSIARECMKTSRYKRGALPSEAPYVVDCSSFMKWLYGQRGIWLPRRSIQQREFGEKVQLEKARAGDLVFVKGVFDWYYDDPSDGVGHVGILTENKTVIHACDKKVNIIESSFERFIGKLKFRGIRRYVPVDKKVITLEIPPDTEVESSDDLRWLVLQTL